MENSMERNDKAELMELRHEPVPGYRRALYIALALGVLYLGAIFLLGPMGGH